MFGNVSSLYSLASRVSLSGPFSVLAHQQRCMSKYLSKAAKKRLPLTTKRARKGFYKGNRSTKEGRLTSKGKFIVDPMKRLRLVVPDLTGFKVSQVAVIMQNGTFLFIGVSLSAFIRRDSSSHTLRRRRPRCRPKRIEVHCRNEMHPHVTQTYLTFTLKNSVCRIV